MLVSLGDLQAWNLGPLEGELEANRETRTDRLWERRMSPPSKHLCPVTAHVCPSMSPVLLNLPEFLAKLNFFMMSHKIELILQDSVSSPDAELAFANHIDKHMVTNFSALELHLRKMGHSFGVSVLRHLGIHRFCTAIQNLN